MVSTTILLYSKESPQPFPRPIQGYSGTIYAYAAFNASQGRMEHRLPLKEYLAICEDLENNKHRTLCKWVVIPEIEEVLEGKEKELADTLAEVTAERDQLKATLDALKNPASLDVKQALAEVRQPPTPPVNPAPAPDPAPVRADLQGKRFRELRSIAKRLGVSGCEEMRTSQELIIAITAL